MINSDIDLYNILKDFYYHDFGDTIPVFRDKADEKAGSIYIVYSSINRERIYASGQVLSTIEEFEIVLVQKNQNNIDLKKNFIDYLTFSELKISNQTETTSIEETDEYYFLNTYTQILT